MTTSIVVGGVIARPIISLWYRSTNSGTPMSASTNIVEHVRTIMNLKNQANHARNATEKTVFERSINAVNDELNTLIDALYQVEAQENGDEE